MHAYGTLLARDEAGDRDVLPDMRCRVNGVEDWPALATALASLSGWFEEAENEAALDTAVQQGASLLSAGVVDNEQLQTEILDVVRELCRWCQRHEATACN